jgi:hypothetical protein
MCSWLVGGNRRFTHRDRNCGCVLYGVIRGLVLSFVTYRRSCGLFQYDRQPTESDKRCVQDKMRTLYGVLSRCWWGRVLPKKSRLYSSSSPPFVSFKCLLLLEVGSIHPNEVCRCFNSSLLCSTFLRHVSVCKPCSRRFLHTHNCTWYTRFTFCWQFVVDSSLG